MRLNFNISKLVYFAIWEIETLREKPVILGSTCAVLPSDIYGIPFIHRGHLAGNWYFVPLSVFYTQPTVGRPHSVRSPRFIPETVFYTQSVMLGPRFIPQFMFYTQSAVRIPQSAVLFFCTDRAQNNVLLLAANVFGDEGNTRRQPEDKRNSGIY